MIVSLCVTVFPPSTYYVTLASTSTLDRTLHLYTGCIYNHSAIMRRMAFKHKLNCDYYKNISTFIQLIVFLLLSLCPFLQIHASTHETWPWLAYIPSLNCTGAIVHNRWMITASNCFLNKSIPSELLVQVQDFNSAGKVQGIRQLYVIDYTRGSSTHGFTMLYLAQTVPSLTESVVAMRAKNANMDNITGIVLSWDSRRAYDANDVNIFALSVDIEPCVANSTRHVCVSLSKHLASSSSILQYCSSTSLGSSLVTIDENGLVSLAGVLHERAACQPHSNFIGSFLRVDYRRKWIRQQFRIQGM